ncbi:MAG: hypothetical protein GY820_38885 [Gammaproteobacteria bacterium]|nr:hypothetical protein [Gammaproteobacteria bacterium]
MDITLDGDVLTGYDTTLNGDARRWLDGVLYEPWEVVAAVSEPLITEDENFYLIYEDSDQIVTEGD